MSETLVEARGLIKKYGAGTRVVDEVSFTIARGETLGLVGESGSGKSTVARMLLRLIEPSAGQILYNATEADGQQRTLDLMRVPPRGMRRLRRRLSIVFQDPYAALDPRMTVQQTLAEPFSIHGERPPQGLEDRLHEVLREGRVG